MLGSSEKKTLRCSEGHGSGQVMGGLVISFGMGALSRALVSPYGLKSDIDVGFLCGLFLHSVFLFFWDLELNRDVRTASFFQCPLLKSLLKTQ